MRARSQQTWGTRRRRCDGGRARSAVTSACGWCRWCRPGNRPPTLLRPGAACRRAKSSRPSTRSRKAFSRISRPRTPGLPSRRQARSTLSTMRLLLAKSLARRGAPRRDSPRAARRPLPSGGEELSPLSGERRPGGAPRRSAVPPRPRWMELARVVRLTSARLSSNFQVQLFYYPVPFRQRRARKRGWEI